MNLILDTNTHFGAQLRAIRKEKRIKQIHLAAKMDCTPDNITHFEKGDNTYGKGSIQTVFKYARALGFTQVTFNL